MKIKRKVRTVDREIGVERRLHLPSHDTDQRLHTAPEQAVMHEQQRHAARDRLRDHGLTRIHRGGDLFHRAGVFDLKSVPRAGVVGDGSGAQRVVEVLDDGVERGHGEKFGGLPILGEREKRRPF